MIRKYPLLLSCLLLFSLYACKKKEGPAGPQGPQGPSAPQRYGVIAGHILQFDPYGIQRNHDLDGATVYLTDNITTHTDTNGYYEFDSVVTGNYNIKVRYPGLYGGTMSGYMAFVGDTLYKSLRITQRPDFDLTGFVAFHAPGSKVDSLLAIFPAGTKVRNWIVFVSNNPNVDQEHYLLRYIISIPTFATTSILTVSATDLNNAGIKSGDIAYYAAYSYVSDDKSAYVDPSTGLTFYTAIGNQIVDTTAAP